ncbi:hypothetical protein L249_0308 [Ophiocordyceps polyrhachis-furcata BCC 54312]|uniref:Multiple RNA-binding domain-containing protein 1 n=1 Tax=Ophiocordyceps polyrhachis-furcata BCC 54312 TaxID=1330021 RepID=A0A367LG12_9HYPO|nr:hypothetical protein L249_0308 [Ophiocordyceps polyrhachis-furcata BCC 54312]
MATSRIFVKGLPPNITEAELRKHFSGKNGHITDVKVIPHRRIGYLGFKSPEEASQATKYFHRSFIRLSRISVEPAKPISDQTLGKRHDSIQSTAQPIISGDSNPKKRKRHEEPRRTDPKLREFLRVMKSREQGVAADESESEHETTAPAATQDASDDEYEQLPSKSQKLCVTPPRDDVDDDANHPEKTIAEPVVPATDDGKAPKTDEDWLRSRTSRLLDLVDPEDLAVGSAPRPSDGAAKRDMNAAQDTLHSSEQVAHDTTVEPREITNCHPVEAISKTSRLFVRNLPYDATEDDIRDTFDKFGALQEVHLPTNAMGSSKGFALVLFTDASDAVKAFQALDGATFQGRIIHIIPAAAKKQAGPDEFGISTLSLRKQNLIRKRAEAPSTTFSWNSLYMSQDAVNSAVAQRLGVSKSELLDPTSAEAAVRQAIAETTVIQETKSYFAANGVDLEAFKSQKRGDTAILVKNFPHGTSMEELRRMFEEFGPVLRVLMPPSGTIAIVQFAQASHAKTAFGKLAYRRIRDSVLFLERAPRDVLKEPTADVDRPGGVAGSGPRVAGVQKLSVNELLSGGTAAEPAETTSLFIRNLNFATSTGRLAEAFKPLDGFVSARVKTKSDPKKPGQTLSMGFGFVEFRSKAQAQAALQTLDGFVLDGHALVIRASHRGHDAAEERRREDRARKAATLRTKIVVKNLPFQATKKDVRALFGTYGQLRSVRVPKKADHTTRGFAFADFVTSREAESALKALRDTHLLGRRLVLEYAEAEAVDAEEEIEKMQRKVGGQVNKVALEQLTAGGRRRKVNIGNDGEEAEE